MGCKNSKLKEKIVKDIEKRIESAIEHDDYIMLCKVVDQSKERKVDVIDQPFIATPPGLISPLTYSLLKGSYQCYKILWSHYNSSHKHMENELIAQNKDVLSYICQNGFIDLLKVILSNDYLAKLSQNNQKSETLGFNRLPYSISPIHTGILNGHVNVVSFLASNSELNDNSIFDIHYIDPITQENSAFMSVRSCSFPMIKLLHETYNVDFTLLNSKNQTVYQVLAEISRTSFSYNQLECLMYLAEVIKLDVEVNYQEVVNTLENRSMLKYYQQKLMQKGITANKTTVYNSSLEMTKDLKLSRNFSSVSQILSNSSKSNFNSSSLNISDVA